MSIFSSTRSKQIKKLAIANMKSRYRKTFAGFLWVVMNPILMYGAQSIAFRTFLKLELDNFFVFLLGGLLPWIFISQTLDMTTNYLASSGGLIRSFNIDPLVMLLSQVLDNFFNFLFAFAFLLIPLSLSKIDSFYGFFFLPIGLLILVAGVISLSWFLAVTQVFLKDTKFVVQFLLSVTFFLTPVFYPISYVPEEYRIFIEFNPFYALIEPVRATIYNFEPGHMLYAFGKGLAFVAFFIAISVWNWKVKKNEFYLRI